MAKMTNGTIRRFGLLRFILLAGLIGMMGFPAKPTFAQYINLPSESHDEGYENYGIDGYENYAREIISRKLYDNFGNFLVEGFPVYTLRHNPITLDGSSLGKSRQYLIYFQNLIISQDKYKGFSSSFIIGDAVRTRFSPHILNLARFNGIRWDGYTGKNNFSMISSRLTDPIAMPLDLSVSVPQVTTRNYSWATYLLGGTWRTEIGDVLNLTGSYVNMFQTETGNARPKNSLSGAVTPINTKTGYFVIRIADDSPGANELSDGAILYERPIVQVSGSIPADSATSIPFTTFLLPIQEPNQYPVDIAGTDIQELKYELPDGTKRIHATLSLANDYSVEAYQTYPVGTSDAPRTGYSQSMLVARADGNVKDQSNKKRITFDYGMNTGKTIYGLALEANLLGFHFNGEFDVSQLHQKFPDPDGYVTNTNASSWYLQSKRRMGMFTVGAEFFEMNPNYQSDLTIMNGSDSSTYYFSLVDDNDDNDRYADGSSIIAPGPYGYSATNILNPQNSTKWISAAALASFSDQYYIQNQNEVYDAQLPRPDAGIFPGVDENNDGVPDDDQNSNGEPDYAEPFMMFYRDPQRFDFGDDWNNNDVIDSRENDLMPDYLYRPDTKGHHVFSSFQPGRNFILTVGTMRQDAISFAGQNYSDYLKFNYYLQKPNLGRLQLGYSGKRVQDNIPDPGFQYQESAIGYSMLFNYNAELYYQNSFAHSYFALLGYDQIPNLMIEGKIKVDVNHQYEPDRVHNADTHQGDVTYYGFVFPKISYRIPLNESMDILLQYKRREEKREEKFRDANTNLFVTDLRYDRRWSIPIIRFNYKMTEKTQLRLGYQGFSTKNIHDKLDDKGVFAYRYRDFKDANNDFNKQIFLGTIANHTQYGGYELWLQVGFQTETVRYVEPAIAALKDSENIKIIVEVVAGY
ncbi:MAG: hypothetical protein CO167_11680 [Candidatus Marinimicrobia bacterium CG_4_9_14_3_um_filter_48_9]|nr:MAG: hypothetical protein CO167_11680 [Candidatus Marinimicrobia bacterium CG_4_9_14_3_um_filter_48_9]